MSNPETASYETELLIGGPIKSRDDTPLAADTYYYGMPLAFVPTVSAVTGTGNGVVTVLAPGKRQAADIVVTFTAALVFNLVVNSVAVMSDIALPDGSFITINYNGLTINVTDGSTAWVAADVVTISATIGAYAYDITEIQNIYIGPDARVLASAGQGSTLTEGDVMEGGIVDSAGDALTITEGMILNAEEHGIYIKNKKTA